MLHRINIRTKLNILLIITVFFFTTLILASYITKTLQKNEFSAVYNVRFKIYSDTQDIDNKLLDANESVYKILTWKSLAYPETKIQEEKDRLKNTLNSLETLTKKNLTERSLDTKEKVLFEKLVTEYKNYSGWVVQFLDMIDIDINMASMFISSTEDSFRIAELVIIDIKNLESDYTDISYDRFNKYFDIAFIIIGILFVISLTILSILSFFIQKSITGPIGKLLTGMNVIAEGNFTHSVNISTDDEIGNLGEKFNWFKTAINADLLEVNGVTEKASDISREANTQMEIVVNTYIKEIKESVSEIELKTAEGVTSIIGLEKSVKTLVQNSERINIDMDTQKKSVNESAVSIEQMARNIDTITLMSINTKALSAELSTKANTGLRAVNNTITSIKEIDTYSQQISAFINLIRNIADQTGILAMNAAIEASHAGEFGRGFAVVAAEIRKMSDNTNGNAVEIGNVLKTIIQKINETVVITENAGESLKAITELSGKNKEVIENLFVLINEQKNAANDMLKSIQEIVVITGNVVRLIETEKDVTNDFASSISSVRVLSELNNRNILKYGDNMESMIIALENISKLVNTNMELNINLSENLKKFTLEK